MPRPLRVAVPPSVVEQPPHTSTGRIWRRAVDGMRAQGIDVVVRTPGRLHLRRPDVWLTDGHQGPLDVDRPLVVHLHEAAWSDPETQPMFDPTFLAAQATASAAAAGAATRILTVSASSRDQIVASYGVDPADVDVAYNGIDHDVYRPGALLTTRVPRPYVLFVSSVHPRKNLGVLREAMGRVGADRSLSLVLVAGPAPDRADSGELLAAAAAPIPGVEQVVNLAGASDDVVAGLMASAAVFCLPSLMEGFGMAVAEAMACGAPCIVSNRGSLPEVVGDTAVVVEPTVDAVTEALIRLLDDPPTARDLASRAMQRSRRFTWEAMVDGWVGCLQRAADA
jgi:glycosyltransferase involved in cell wall biosynthesis